MILRGARGIIRPKISIGKFLVKVLRNGYFEPFFFFFAAAMQYLNFAMLDALPQQNIIYKIMDKVGKLIMYMRRI